MFMVIAVDLCTTERDHSSAPNACLGALSEPEPDPDREPQAFRANLV
jgi:hypothetical protein